MMGFWMFKWRWKDSLVALNMKFYCSVTLHSISESNQTQDTKTQQGLQYLLLDLGGGCFGMDSFHGRKAAVEIFQLQVFNLSVQGDA